MGAQVGVQVDEPRRDQLPGRIDALRRAVGRDAGRHRRDLTVLDPDVALAAEPHARIQNVPAGDHELVLQRGVARIEPAWHRHRHDVAGGGLGLRLRERGAGRDRSG